jgi:YVTN family beta-propeller protein
MFTSAFRLRRFSLTAICLSLLFIAGLNGAINTTQAQARAYVANACNNTVAVVDTGTNTVITTIPVGAEPFIPAVTPDGTRVYVTSRTGQSVSVIDTATNTVIKTIPFVGFAPTGVAITPDGTRAYVTTTTTIFVIDTSTNTVIASIPDRFAFTYAAITPDGTRLYVTHGFTLQTHTVTVFDTASNALITTIFLLPLNPLPVRSRLSIRRPTQCSLKSQVWSVRVESPLPLHNFRRAKMIARTRATCASDRPRFAIRAMPKVRQGEYKLSIGQVSAGSALGVRGPATLHSRLLDITGGNVVSRLDSRGLCS